MKKTLLFGIVLVMLLTAGCSLPQENTAHPDTNVATSAPQVYGRGSSRSDPATINEAVVFTETANDSGQGTTSYSARLTLLEVRRGTAAYEKIKQSYPFNLIDIQAGREFVVVRFKYELLDTSKTGAYRLVNRDSFGIYRDGNFDAEDNRYIIGATPDFYGKAKKGDTVDGWFSFTVPKDGSWPLVVYGRTSSGSGGIWFKTG